MKELGVWLIQKIGRRPAIVLMALVVGLAITVMVTIAAVAILAFIGFVIHFFGLWGTLIVVLIIVVAMIGYDIISKSYPEQKAKDK